MFTTLLFFNIPTLAYFYNSRGCTYQLGKAACSDNLNEAFWQLAHSCLSPLCWNWLSKVCWTWHPVYEKYSLATKAAWKITAATITMALYHGYTLDSYMIDPESEPETEVERLNEVPPIAVRICILFSVFFVFKSVLYLVICWFGFLCFSCSCNYLLWSSC